MSVDVALIAVAVVAFALISRRIGPTPISAPMVFVALGLLSAPQVLDLIDLGFELPTIDLLGEATLAILLFADASRIDTRALRREYMLPLRLLAVGLPLTVLVTTFVLLGLVDDLNVWHAALIAAILSPTDAALGQEVVSDASVPARQGLTVESGLNDGLIVPAVAIFLALALEEGETGSVGWWAGFVGRQVGLGLVVGVLVGVLGALAMNAAHQSNWIEGIWAQLATLALAILALTTATSVDGNGFIAAGIAFGKLADESERLGEYTEDTAQLAAAISFFLFGNLLLGPALREFSLTIVLCALLTLTVGRMVPVALSLVGTGAAWPTRAFIGWFGPRGLASILFGLILLEEDLDGANELFAVVAWTVLFSVVVHGATAAAGAKRYGTWWGSMPDEQQAHLPEAMPVEDQRNRRM